MLRLTHIPPAGSKAGTGALAGRAGRPRPGTGSSGDMSGRNAPSAPPRRRLFFPSRPSASDSRVAPARMLQSLSSMASRPRGPCTAPRRAASASTAPDETTPSSDASPGAPPRPSPATSLAAGAPLPPVLAAAHRTSTPRLPPLSAQLCSSAFTTLITAYMQARDPGAATPRTHSAARARAASRDRMHRTRSPIGLPHAACPAGSLQAALCR